MTSLRQNERAKIKTSSKCSFSAHKERKRKMKYWKLRGKISEKFRTLAEFNKALGCAPRTLQMKLKGERQFDVEDINKIVNLLDLSKSEIIDYFFTEGEEK